MPLKQGSGQETISENIRRLRHEGYEADQAAAIAYERAGKSRKPRKHREAPAAPGRLRGVEIFRAGSHRGKAYSEADLDAMAENFNRFSTGPKPLLRVPAVLGHDEDQRFLERSDLPAAAWAERCYREGDTLKCDFADVAPQVRPLLDGKAYRKVSAEVYDEPPEGVPGRGKMLRRVAFLGGDIPHVKGLADIPAVSHSEAAFAAPAATRLELCEVRPTVAGTFCVFAELRPMAPSGAEEDFQDSQRPEQPEAPPGAAPSAPSEDDLKERLAEHGFTDEDLQGATPQLLAAILRVLDAKDNPPESFEDEPESFEDEPAPQAGSAAPGQPAPVPPAFADQGAPPPRHTGAVEQLHQHTHTHLHGGATEMPQTEQQPALFSEAEVAEIRRLFTEDAGAAVAELRAAATAERAAARKRRVDADVDRLGAEGKLPPAARDRLVRALMGADATAVLEKFSEGGKDVELTQYDLVLRSFEALPSKFAEHARAAGTPAAADTSAGEAFYDTHLANSPVAGDRREWVETYGKATPEQRKAMTSYRPSQE